MRENNSTDDVVGAIAGGGAALLLLPGVGVAQGWVPQSSLAVLKSVLARNLSNLDRISKRLNSAAWECEDGVVCSTALVVCIGKPRTNMKYSAQHRQK